MMRLNPFLEEYKPKVAAYFDVLVKVDDPEDHLQVNKYMELTQKTKPMIQVRSSTTTILVTPTLEPLLTLLFLGLLSLPQISLHEIFQTHQMIHKHLQGVAPSEDDPLRKVMADLGNPPEYVDLTEVC